MLPISGIVITKNEERMISRCLASMAWCNEIIVVDAFSSDRTPAICQATGMPWSGKVKFFQRDWQGFSDQRNFSLSKASFDWVFLLDADEACSEDLQRSIKELLSRTNGPDQKRYEIRRVEYFLGKEIRYGIWNPSSQARFFYRPEAKYSGLIHENLSTLGNERFLSEPIFHNPDFHVEHFLTKMNHYTSLQALDRFKNGRRTNLFHLFFELPAMCWKNYFYYRAWKDGYAGFVISLLEGISRLVIHIKLWQLQQKEVNHEKL
jgi:glycosyltransferase involved in cell wall biosynthesis